MAGSYVLFIVVVVSFIYIVTLNIKLFMIVIQCKNNSYIYIPKRTLPNLKHKYTHIDVTDIVFMVCCCFFAH